MKTALLTLFLKRLTQLLYRWAGYLDAWVNRLEQSAAAQQTSPTLEKPLSPPAHWLEKTRHLDASAWLGSGQTSSGSAQASCLQQAASQAGPFGHAASPTRRSFPHRFLQTLPQRCHQLLATTPAGRLIPQQQPGQARQSSQVPEKAVEPALRPIHPPAKTDTQTIQPQPSVKRQVLTTLEETPNAIRASAPPRPATLSSQPPHSPPLSADPHNFTAEAVQPRANTATNNQQPAEAITPPHDGSCAANPWPDLSARPNPGSPATYPGFPASTSGTKPAAGSSQTPAETGRWPSLPPETGQNGTLATGQFWREYQRLQVLEKEQRSLPWIV